MTRARSGAIRRTRVLEQTLADELERLVTAPPERLDATLLGAQRTLVQVLGMERSAIWQEAPDRPGRLALTHLASLDAPLVVPPGLAAGDAFPWITARLREGQTVAIPDVDALPKEAAADRRSLQHYGNKSTLAIPLLDGAGVTRGAISFAAPGRHQPWPEAVVTSCRLVAQVIHGVLARSRSQAELERVRAQLLQSQKMEALGRLAGGVAHDFNNLLTVILGFSSDVLGRLGPGPLADDLAEVLKAGRRAADLTHQLLTFSSQQPGRPQALDLRAAVRDAERLLRRLLRADVELTLELPEAPAWVVADPSELVQVVMNLAVNASDAMPRGGALSIAVAPARLAGGEHPGLPAGPYVALRVRDTGAGIAPEHLPRVFEPFFTTKERGKGTGLGLATVHGIARRAGGDARIESAPGAGTTVTVLLPAGAAPGAEAGAAPAPAAAGGGETVLVVEDDPAVRRVLERILRPQGYRVLTAADGAEALALASPERAVDLVLTDLVLPACSGPELARRLRARRPPVRVLFMSGRSDDAPEELAALTAAPILAKPFTPEAVGAAVRAALDGAGRQ